MIAKGCWQWYDRISEAVTMLEPGKMRSKTTMMSRGKQDREADG
jgi:hypothetical protein